jgi:hypothetical protein
VAKGIRYACSLFAMGLFGIPVGSSPPEEPMDTRAIKFYQPAKLRAECERLQARGPHCLGGYTELNDFIHRLGNAGEEDALRLIIAEELPGTEDAAACYTRVLSPSDGIRFVRTLKPYSRGWRAMLWALSSTNGREIS